MMPTDYRNKFKEIDIDSKVAEDIISDPELTRTVGRILDSSGVEHARRIAFWLLQEQPEDESMKAGWTNTVSDEQLIKLSKLVANNKLSSTAAKQVLAILQIDGGDAEKVAEKLNLIQVSDEDEIAKIVEQIIKENPQAASDVKNGEMKAIGFLVGQVMKASKGKANPQMAQNLIKRQLEQ
jgi:Asp-tRNA(Asn)/Glu-tRNA(Gln) amidotransferase B subunit